MPNDILMNDTSAINLDQTPSRRPATTERPRPLTASCSEGSIPVANARPPAVGSRSSILARLEAAAQRKAAATYMNNPSSRPIDKYTKGPMPTVHDPTPTTVLDNINPAFAAQWGNFQTGKLLAIPFGTDALDINTHEITKDKLLAAVTEVTQASLIGISSPKPSQHAERTPISFLIYNLTEDQRDTLLERRVWSSTAITFRVTKINPSCPEYLFTLRGFATTIESNIFKLVKQVFQDDDTLATIEDIADAYPDDTTLRSSLVDFLNSFRITLMNYKLDEHTLRPHYNVYADSALVDNDQAWSHLREFLAFRIYESAIEGQGQTSIAPFDCPICHGVDHPAGFCAFPAIPGWNRPVPKRRSERSEASSSRGRGGRGRGLSQRARGPSNGTQGYSRGGRGFSTGPRDSHF